MRFLAQSRGTPDSLRFLLHINLSEPRKNELLYESKVIKEHLGQLEKIIVLGSDSGQLRPNDICFSDRAFIGILFILAILYEFYPADAVNRSSEKDLARKAVEMFMNGLERRDSAPKQ